MTALISSGCVVLPFPSVTRLAPPIEGRVYDETQQVAVSNAEVQLRINGEVHRVATTDADGRFHFGPSQQRHWGIACGIPVGAPWAYKIPNPEAIYYAGHADLLVDHPQYETWMREFKFGDTWESDEWFHEQRTIEVSLAPLGLPAANSASTVVSQASTLNP